jgi:hypothetical protein
MWTTVFVLMIVLIGLCLLPIAMLVHAIVPIWSALSLKGQLARQPF